MKMVSMEEAPDIGETQETDLLPVDLTINEEMSVDVICEKKSVLLRQDELQIDIAPGEQCELYTMEISPLSPPHENKKTFDDLLINHLGQFGRYQWFMFLCLSLAALGVTWHNLIHVFTGAEPEFYCSNARWWNSSQLGSTDHTEQINDLDNTDVSIRYGSLQNDPNVSSITSGYYSILNDASDNNTDIESQTEICFHTTWNTSSVNKTHSGDLDYNIPCSKWFYDKSQYTSSIVTEWDLVCDQRWVASFVQSLHMLGCMIGSVLFGQLSDRYGRRKILLVCTFLEVVVGISTAFVPWLELYTLFRFIIGMAIAGQFNCAYIIAIEIVGPKWRSLAGIMMMCSSGVSIMTMAGLAYMVREWRHLQLVISAPLVLLLTYIITAPESPRWLLVNNKIKDAKLLIRRLAKFNNKSLPEDYIQWLDCEGKSQHKSGEKYSTIDLFRTPQIRVKSMTLCFIWFVISVTYYGLSLYTSNLGGNDYLNFFLSGAVELPAYTFSIWCLHRFGRRTPLVISMATAGVSLIMTSPLSDKHQTVRIVLSMAGKMCISVAFVIIYPFSVESFPTVIRSNGLGFVGLGARIGGFVAPYILLLGTINGVIPLVVCGVLALIGSLFAGLLPDTHNLALPETIQDAEQIRNSSLKQLFRRMRSTLSKKKPYNQPQPDIDTSFHEC